MGVELATAYLTLVPSLRGASKSIAAQLGGIDVSKSGQALGKSLGASMSKAFESDGVAKMQTAVRAAEKGVRDAMAGSEEATKRVEIAQQRLNEARAKYGDKSSQAMQAELNLANAQRKQTDAANSLTGAQTRLERAQMDLKSATDAATAAAQRQNSVFQRASNSLATVSTVATNAGKKISGAGESLMNVGGTLTQGITLPMAAAVAAVGGFALSTASAAETTEISFTTMLGSAEAANDMMGQLADFAASTPFELSGLQTATRQLLAYGFTADEVVPMLTAVGDATAALGTGQAGIEAVTRALGQMQTRGKVSAEEMLQLTEAGIPAWEYLARAIGTDTAGAMQAVTDGAIDAQTGIDALTKGMEEDFGGMMESQSKTVAGLMSNLADAIQQPLMELRNSDAYDAFADALEKVVDAAGPLVESMLPLMEDGLSGLAGMMDSAAASMEQFASMSTESKKELLQTAAAAAAAGPALTVLGGGLRVVGGAAQGIGGIIGGLSTALGKAAGGAGGLTGALGLLKGGLAGLAIGVVAAGVAAFATEMLKAKEHSDLFNSATQSTSDILADVSSSMGAASVDVDALLESLQGVNEEAKTTLAELGTQSGLLDTYVGTIEELAGQSNLTAAEQAKLGQAVEGYNEITGDSVEITDAAQGALSKSTEEIRENAEAWKYNAEQQAYAKLAGQYIEEQITAEQNLAQAQEELATAQQKLNEARELDPMSDPGAAAKLAVAQEQYDQARQKVDELSGAYDSASEKAEDFGNMAAVSASSLSTELKEALQGLDPALQDEGLNMAASLAAGIEAGTVTVDAAASFISSGVKDAISSLSVGAQEQGMAVATTLADGISAGSVSVDTATQFMVQGVGTTIAGLAPSLQGSGLTVANTLAQGISTGQLSVTTATQFMTQGVQGIVAQLPPLMQQQGMNAANMLASSLSSGQINVVQATQILNAAATGTVSSLPPELQGLGNEAAAMLGTGLSDTSGTASAAASQVAAADGGLAPMGALALGRGTEGASGFDSGLGSGNPGGVASQQASAAESGFGGADAYGEGANLAQTFINGIGSLVGAAASAASNLANAAKSAISSALGIGSPSKVAMRLANWTVEGFIIPFKERVGDVESAATAMGVATARGLETASDFDKSVWDKWSSFTRGAETALAETQNTMNALADPFRELSETEGAEVDEFGNFIIGLSDGVNDLVSKNSKVKKAGDLFKRAGVDFTDKFVEEVMTGTKGYLDHIDELSELTDEQLQGIVDAYEDVRIAEKEQETAARSLRVSMQKELDTKTVRENIDDFRNVVLDLKEALYSDDGLNRAFERSGLSLEDFSADVMAFGTDMDTVSGKVSDFASKVSDGFNAMASDEQTGLRSFRANLENNIVEAQNWQRDVEKVFSALEGWGGADDFRAAVLEGGYEKWGRVMEELADSTGHEIWNTVELYNAAMETGAKTGMESVSAIIEQTDTERFKSLGINVSSGIAKGITDGSSAVVNAVSQVCAEAISTANSALGIASPSKVFARIGDYVIEGLVSHVSAGKAAVAGAMEGTVLTAVKSAQNAADYANAMRGSKRAAMASRVVGDGTKPLAVEQTIQFNTPTATPAQVARTMKRYAHYGLAGAR